jgi:RHS repeat-associated protein
LGNRVAQAVSGGDETRYVLDQAAGLVQVLSDGSDTYLYGNERLAQQGSGGKEYFLTDALGSVRQLVDEYKAITLTRSYQPFGEVLTSTGTGSSVYGYTGEMTDSYIKLIYLRSRYYSSDAGRFISKDTWQGDYNLPMSNNKWLFVYDNSINLTDPSGQKPIWWGGYPSCPPDGCSPMDDYCWETAYYKKMASTGVYIYPDQRPGDPRLTDNGKAAFRQFVAVRTTPGWWDRFKPVTYEVFAKLVLNREFFGLQNENYRDEQKTLIAHGATHWCATVALFYNGSNCTGSEIAVLNWIGNSLEVSLNHHDINPNGYLQEEGGDIDLAISVINKVINPPDPEWTRNTLISNEPGRWGNGTYDGPDYGILLKHGDGPTAWYLLREGYSQYFTVYQG